MFSSFYVEVFGPCWADMQRTVPAKIGDPVAVVDRAVNFNGEWLAATAPIVASRPTLDRIGRDRFVLRFSDMAEWQRSNYTLPNAITTGIARFPR